MQMTAHDKMHKSNDKQDMNEFVNDTALWYQRFL